MNVLVIQPGFPAEIPHFVRGLARVGARVLGIGDQPRELLPDVAKQGLAAYLQIPGLWNTSETIKALRQWDLPLKLHRIECLWEPGMMLAAELREAFKIPGLTVNQTLLFRDKERMKRALDQAGIRTPRHASAKTETECRYAARKVGYPLIIKPISGAGSANTYRVDHEREFESILPRLRNVTEVSIEEFIQGEEYTFDTICAGGHILFANVAWYRPNVLIARSQERISPQTITLRNMTRPGIQAGVQMGQSVLQALGFRTGFTHMEWFLTPEGEAVFGEIGARPPGGRSVELMNYGSDIDVFSGWAEAITGGGFTQKINRNYNAAVIFKRALGHGKISRIEGLRPLEAKFGKYIVCNNLSPIGAQRRDWKQTLVSDGYLILRHPDLATTLAMADEVAEKLVLYATA